MLAFDTMTHHQSSPAEVLTRFMAVAPARPSRSARATLSLALGATLLAALSLLSTTPALAGASASTNFSIPAQVINAGVGPMNSSAQRLLASVGDSFATPTGSSANFIGRGGLLPITQNITVVGTPQSISFATLVDRLYATTPFALAATASSGLTVSFASVTPEVCSVEGNNVTMIELGICTIRAGQSGSATVAAANPIERSFRVLTVIVSGSARLTSSQNPIPLGLALTLTARIDGIVRSGDTATGFVVFSETLDNGSVVLCDRVAVVDELARCAVPMANRGVGNHAYVARYQGDAANAMASASLLQTVSVSGTTVTINATPIRPASGLPLLLTTVVSGVRPTGTIRLRDGDSDVPGCANLTLIALPRDAVNAGTASNAVASCAIASVAAGNRSYTALYSSDANNAASQATLSFTVPVTGPLDYSDLWWAGAGENGWGMTIMQKGLIQVNAFYIYDAQGNPTWFVMPGGSWDPTFTRFTGALYQTGGSAYFSYDATRFNVPAPIGSGTLTFNSANSASFDYTINGQTGRKQIVRQPFGVRDSSARLLVRDLWWGGRGEDGWGISIAQQDRNLFAVWFTYDAAGRPTWFVMSDGRWDDNVYTGALYSTTSSPWLGAVYDPTRFRINRVGTLSISFADQDNATMRYTVNGVTQSKVIVRQPY